MRWAVVWLGLATRALGASLFSLEAAAGVLERSVVDFASNATTPNAFTAQLQLQGYNNPGGIIVQSNTNFTCLNPNPGKGGGDGLCHYTFIATLAVMGSPPVILNDATAYKTSSGTVNLSSSSLWSSVVQASFPLKPEALVVNVFHSGNIYQLNATGYPSQFGPNEPLVLVDTFVVDMIPVVPLTKAFSPAGGFTTPATKGQRSSLTMKFALRCAQAGASGPDCNLFCTPPARNGTPAQCTVKMGQISDPNVVCASMKSSSPLTVDTAHTYWPCKACPCGVTVTAANGAVCNSCGANPSTAPVTTGLVAGSYKTATTALAICFVIAGLIVIGLAVRMYMTKKKHSLVFVKPGDEVVDKADEAEYVRRRNAWSERPNVELTSKDNKAFNHKPDPDASETETDTSDSQSQTSSNTGSHTSHATGKSGSVVVGIPGGVPPADPHEATDQSHQSSRRPSEAPSHDPSQHSHPRTGSHSSAEQGRTTPRIEARV